MEEDKITISLEEYKELLIIKGKYEELKSQQQVQITPSINPIWTETYYGYYGELTPKEIYKITCENKEGE